MQHAPFFWTHIIGFITGGGAVRLLIYISKQMPPLPAGAGWWQQFLYSLVKGTSGLDPNATIITSLKP